MGQTGPLLVTSAASPSGVPVLVIRVSKGQKNIDREVQNRDLYYLLSCQLITEAERGQLNRFGFAWQDCRKNLDESRGTEDILEWISECITASSAISVTPNS
jgi:hypothetical protein